MEAMHVLTCERVCDNKFVMIIIIELKRYVCIYRIYMKSTAVAVGSYKVGPKEKRQECLELKMKH